MTLSLVEKLEEKKWELCLLFMMIVLGMFLRTYYLHDWLHFGSDQARDIMLVERVVETDASWPSLGADASNTHFKLGPMYYYFQIISVMLFGNDPAVLAYPDVLFSLLSIPLFFFLLRRYFNSHTALLLTGLYTVSYYAVEYSRFAWNTNPIPFFVMLFLLALLEILRYREKTHGMWVILLGVSLGVGIQLHTLLLLLLPFIFIVAALYLLKSSRKVWSKLVFVLGIALLCNVGQIKSELYTNWANTRLFFVAFTDRSESGTGRFWKSLQMDVLDHVEANMHMLTSLGDRGNFIFPSLLFHPEKTKNHVLYGVYLFGIVMSFGFSVFGYFRLAYLAYKEKDMQKKYFLSLLLLYAALSFLIIFSVARGAPLRYFIHTIFIPFIFLGLLIDWFKMKVPRRFAFAIPILVLMLFLANFNTLRVEAWELMTGTRGDSGYVVLGEAERMVDSMIRHSAPQEEADFFGGTQYTSTYYKSLKYLAEKKNFKLNQIERRSTPVSGNPIFFIGQDKKRGVSYDTNLYELTENMNFGRIGIYQLKKK